MKLILPILVLTMTNGQLSKPTTKIRKRSYICPPHFIRLSHRCYFFSEEAVTWQQAYFRCQELHSNLAIIRNANQDKLIRRTLSNKSLVPSERWLGALYDWEQMSWKWGASGKPLVYQGFSQMETEDKDKLRWHCIIVDPTLQYKWNSRSCLEEKKFICHNKIKIVTNKGKKKLLRQYKVSEYNKLNEIPVPVLFEDLNDNSTIYKGPNGVNVNYAEFSAKSKTRKRRTRKNRRKEASQFQGTSNVTRTDQNNRRRRQKIEKDAISTNEHIKWKTYLKKSISNPLHPKVIVEEFNYVHHT